MLLVLLLVFIISQVYTSNVLGQDSVIGESISLTVFSDGFVLATHDLELNQSFPTANFTLLGETRESMLVVDDVGLPLAYSILDGKAIVNSLGAKHIKSSYYTQDLTFKTGRIWTLKTTILVESRIVLPVNTSIISLNCVPELIESSNNQMSLVMPCGLIEIAYVAEHATYQENQISSNWPPFEILILFVSVILIMFLFLGLFLRKKKKPIKTEQKKTVDVDKLLSRNKDLREEEVHVIRFLAERDGTAFEAELYARLNLPRTTTWRLIKRLEKKEIVNVRKSRRQNIVSIRNKYMK